jgi:hypothetical protein
MFVATVASEMLVRTDTVVASARMTRARTRPTDPTTYATRRKRTSPRIVRTLGVKTPPNVPSVPVGSAGDSARWGTRSPGRG